MDISYTAPIQPLNQLARIEPATVEDLPRLVDLTMALFEMEADFVPDRNKQERGLEAILEHPNRGRIFVVRTDYESWGLSIVSSRSVLPWVVLSFYWRM